MTTGQSATQEFEALFVQGVAPAVSALETRRIITWVGAGILFLMATQIGIQISAGLSTVRFLAPLGVVFVLAGFLCGIGGAVWLVWRTNRDLPVLLSRAISGGLGLSFQPGGMIPSEQAFQSLELAPLRGERTVLGLIQGQADGRPFQIAAVQDTAGIGRSRYTTFQGFLVCVRYPTPFPARVLLLREGAGGPPPGLQDVGLVDARFEHRFGVWSDDQIEARVLLDPATIEEILKLDHEIGDGRMQCAFAGSDVLVAIRTVSLPSGRDAWPNMGRSVNHRDRIRTLAWDLFWAARLPGELRPAAAWVREVPAG